ncbi:MAG: hypothetical protein ACH349_07650 [Candidatus Rhabdochlamydia sp.]
MKNEAKGNNRDKFLSSLESTLNQYKRKIKKFSKNMANSTSEGKESLSQAIKNVQKKYQKAEKVYQNLKASTEDDWEDIKSQASEIFDELHDGFNEITDNFSWDHLNQATEEAMDYGQEKLDQLSDCIRKKPFTSALWALGIGFILGKMLRSK